MHIIFKTFKRKKLATAFLIFGIFIGITVLSFNISYMQALKNQNSIQNVDTEKISKIIIPSSSELSLLSEYLLDIKDKSYTEVSLKRSIKDKEYNLKGIYYTNDYTDKNVLGNKKFSFAQVDSTNQIAIVGMKLKNYIYKRDGNEYISLDGSEFSVIGVNELPFNGNSINIPLKTFLKLQGNQNIMDMTFLMISDSISKYSLDQDFQKLLNINGGVIDLTSEQYNVSSGVLNVITFIIIVIAIINVMNFTVLWISERTKEIALRKTVGATNKDIRNLIFNEILALSIVALVISIVFQAIMYRIINSMGSLEIYLQLSIKNIVVSFIVSFLISLLATIPLYFKASEISPVIVLKEE
ncbi:membrane protein [Clostridium zeae]|uniref:Membrane protein n=1 Tax=Clostridium zeae TaxID=2759022 RepID=A0ABQ1EDB9_9CLOT|nr:ABC transporter permease [Clostridium zeae]GFZ32669.1 membrane protein [Clostridium zeae]